MGQTNGRSEKTLEDWRQEIDALDMELLRLLNQRATIAGQIAVVKVAAGLPAYDPRREEQVLERITKKNVGPFEDASLAAIFRSIIHETRRLGTERMQQQSGQKNEEARNLGRLRTKY
jgi:chorismate mutase